MVTGMRKELKECKKELNELKQKEKAVFLGALHIAKVPGAEGNVEDLGDSMRVSDDYLTSLKNENQELKENLAEMTDARKLLVEVERKNISLESTNLNLNTMNDELKKDLMSAAEARDNCRTEFNEFKLQVDEKIKELQELQ